MGSNLAQGKFSFKHLFSLIYNYLGCTESGVLSLIFSIINLKVACIPCASSTVFR